MRLSFLLPITVAFMVLACGLETEPSNPPGSGGSGGSDGGSGSGGSGAGGDSGTTGGSGGSGGSGGDGGGGGGGTGGTGGSTGGTGGTGGSTGGTGGGVPADCDDDDECPATSPACDDGECAPCTSSASCDEREATPYCQETSGEPRVGECVECLEDDHCEGNEDGEYCLSNECVPCKTDADCTDLSKPECSDKGQCVGCTSSEACEGRTGTEVCRTAVGSKRGHCVACVGHGDCTDPAAPECKSEDNTCGACMSNVACEGRGAKTICDTSNDETFGGTCVECTGTQYASCSQGGVEFVCESLTRSCSDSATENSKDACGECVSDAQCQDGKLCVLHTFNDPSDSPDQGSIEIGYFCTWMIASANGPNGSCFNEPPYVSATDDVVSIDRVTADVCLLQRSTCAALNDSVDSKNCGVPAGAPTGGDSELCGHESAPSDGVCVQLDAVTHRCKMPCLNDDDCREGSECDTDRTPDVCIP